MFFCVFAIAALALLMLFLTALLSGLCGGHETEIMFGVLEIVLGGNAVASGVRITGKRLVFFIDVRSRAADLYVGTIAVKSPVGIVPLLASAST